MKRGPKKRAAPIPAWIEPLKSQNVMVAGRRTSMRLEPSMWAALFEIADREKLTVNQICTRIKECLEDQERRRVTIEDSPGDRHSTIPTNMHPMETGAKGGRKSDVTLTSAVRVFIAAYFRRAATESGHSQAGHGLGSPFRGTPFEGDASPDADPRDGTENPTASDQSQDGGPASFASPGQGGIAMEFRRPDA